MRSRIRDGIRNKLPGGWRAKLKGLYRAIERGLGPEILTESGTRKRLRDKLFELSLMIDAVQRMEYWNTRLPSVLRDVAELVYIELADVPSWSRELLDTAMDLQSYGRMHARSALVN
jgi:hypothetical protein